MTEELSKRPELAHKRLLERFYSAFNKRDGDGMAACYAPGAKFDDPVFPGLTGDEVAAMWRMLTSRATDLRLEVLEHDADASTGLARWRATYTFSQTGRGVVNEVVSEFKFADGLISEQRDTFSFYRWSRQALGRPGLLLGWTPVLRKATQRRARAGLDEFMARGESEAEPES